MPCVWNNFLIFDNLARLWTRQSIVTSLEVERNCGSSAAYSGKSAAGLTHSPTKTAADVVAM